MNKQRSTFGRLLGYVKPYWAIYSALLALILIGAGFDLGFSWILMKITDAAVAGNTALVTRMFVLMLALVVVNVGSGYLRSYLVALGPGSVRRDLKNRLFDHILRLPVGTRSRSHSGDLVSRLTNDIGGLEGAIGGNILELIHSPITAAATFVFLVSLNWQLALLCALSGPATILIGRYFGGPMRANQRKLHELLGEINSHLHDTFAGQLVVRAFSLERARAERYRASNARILALEVVGGRLRGGLSAGSQAVGLLTVVVSLGLGAFFVARGELTVGALIAFANLLNQLTSPFQRLAQVWAGVQAALASADRIFAVMDESVDLDDLPAPISPPPLTSGLRFRDVRFGYAPDAPVLDGFSLDVPKGRVVALVGPSGAGKSTVFSLALKLYRPDAGEIDVDGQPLGSLEPAVLRSYMAVVPQETYLFSGTVRSNVLCGRPDASDSEIAEAVRAANADGFIRALPEGFDTQLGERGIRLSGGQRQRLAIARALLKDAPILLLDEATSALDTESEVAVQEALDRLMIGRTTLVVAHRLSTVHNADVIAVMKEGRIVEQGDHDSLIAQGGLYRRLYRLQFRHTRSQIRAAEAGRNVSR